MKRGDSLPEFTLKDQNGEPFNSIDIIGKTPAVVFFYPKNFTPGCTREVCGFRDSFEEFSESGVTVIGISSDSIKSHQKFASKYKLPFTLLSDAKGKAKKLFGVSSSLFGLLPGRETFVFNKEGKLTFKFKSLGADSHIKQALKHI